MQGFTIKSESSEGTYYLVKNWEKHKTFWAEYGEMKPDMLYKTAAAAKASLTKLLKIMDEYRTDKFTLIEWGNWK